MALKMATQSRGMIGAGGLEVNPGPVIFCHLAGKNAKSSKHSHEMSWITMQNLESLLSSLRDPLSLVTLSIAKSQVSRCS